MHNRIRSLEKLVADASVLIEQMREENEVLRKQVEMLGAERGRSASGTAAARELAELKAKVRRRLERICARIEKADELQPGLFEEEDEL